MLIANPSSAEHPVPPEKFAGRIHQISEFDRFLADTIEGNSKNLAIMGEVTGARDDSMRCPRLYEPSYTVCS